MDTPQDPNPMDDAAQASGADDPEGIYIQTPDGPKRIGDWTTDSTTLAIRAKCMGPAITSALRRLAGS